MYPALAWLSEQAPRFPGRSRHNGHIREFLVRILRPVPATQCLDEPYDFAALLKTSRHQGRVDEMRKQRAAGNKQVASGHQNAQGLAGKGCEESSELLQVRFGQNSETGYGIALATIERRRYPPDAAPSVSQFPLFLRRIFPEAVRRISDDSLNGTFRLGIHPNQAIRQVESIPGIPCFSTRGSLCSTARAKQSVGIRHGRYPGNGHTRSMVLLSIQLLSSALRNFMSSRTTVSACSYFAFEFSRIGQSVPHIKRRGP